MSEVISVRFVVDQAQSAHVWLDGSDLVIQAPNDEALLQTTFAVLRALDTKYWCAEPMRGSLLHNRTGLAGKVIE